MKNKKAAFTKQITVCKSKNYYHSVYYFKIKEHLTYTILNTVLLRIK